MFSSFYGQRILVIAVLGITLGSYAAAVSNASHPLEVTIIAYESEKSYFKSGDEITFRIIATHLGDPGGSQVQEIRLSITSDSLEFVRTNGNGFTETNSGELSRTAINNGSSTFVNMTYRVKSKLQPLSSLFIGISGSFKFRASMEQVQSVKSFPILYSMPPQVNITSNIDGLVPVYSEREFEMEIILPEVDFKLWIELNTNVEGIIFMGFKDVYADAGPGFTFNGSSSPNIFSSGYFSTIKDRVVIDLGYLQFSENSASSKLSVRFKVRVYDHHDVADHSSHYFGVAVHAGTECVYIEQQEMVINKMNEPALSLTATSSVDSSARLYVNDEIEVSYTVKHSNNSGGETAKDLAIHVKSDYLDPKDITNYDTINDTTYRIKDSYGRYLNVSQDITATFKMQVDEMLFPLTKISTDMFVLYKNPGTQLKEPVMFSLPPLMSATPLITLIVADSHLAAARMTKKFNLTIFLKKMKTNTQIEVVLPKVEGYPLMYFNQENSYRIITGSNINLTNEAANPEWISSTNYTDMKDQLVVNFGTASTKDIANDADTDTNRIYFEFSAIVNEHPAIANGSNISVVVGVIGKPYMVWINQVDLKTYTDPNSAPIIDFLYSTQNKSSDDFILTVTLKHSPTSSKLVTNVTIEFYFPPFIKFGELDVSDGFIKTNPDKNVFYRKETFGFTTTLRLVIKAVIDRSKSPNTGTFEYGVPAHLKYYDMSGKSSEFIRAVKRSVKVLPRYPMIPMAANKAKEYYSRGILWDASKKVIHLCMNQHMMSYQKACFYSLDYGYQWIAHEHKLGCIIGRDKNDVLYGIDRNQITYLKYNQRFGEYFAITKDDVPGSLTGDLKDLSDANYVEMSPTVNIDKKHELKVDLGKFAGGGDGLYYQANGQTDWALQALWFEQKDFN